MAEASADWPERAGSQGSEEFPSPTVLTARAAEPLLHGRVTGLSTVFTSLDLNLSQSRVTLEQGGILLPGDRRLSWTAVETIAGDPEACWLVGAEGASKIYAFSPALQRAYSLLPTESAPTLINAGFTMHRIKRSDPWQDTRNKIRAAAPVHGRVLDTTTGLGYTAILAAERATEVVTIELDETVLQIARQNPWSQRLFTTPHIRQIVGDSYDEATGLGEASFDLVIHDPPSFSLAGELYSGEFYRRLYRVVRPGGRLFHYIGNPASRQGKTVTRGVLRRLHEAGFNPIRESREAFGVVAHRPRSG